MSQQTVRQNYIQADVFSATPQKLQLLLVEAAIKNILKTKKFWEEENISDGFETITLAQDIVAEILCSFDVENNPEIAKKLSSIYVFIFRRLTEAGMYQDQEKLNDAYRVLCSERETWRLVCEKFGSSKTDGAVSSVGESAQKSIPDASKTTPGATVWSASTPVSGGSHQGTGTYSQPTKKVAQRPQAVSIAPVATNTPLFPTQAPAMPTLGGVSLSSMGIGFNTPTLQSVSPVPSTATESGIPLGQMELIDSLGKDGSLPKLDSMIPPQNANAPTETKSIDTLKTPPKPVKKVGAMYLR